MKIKILEVGVAYAAVCSEIHNQCFEEKHAWNEAAFVSLLEKNASAFLALLDGTPAGVILIQKSIDEIEILTIAVLEENRRRGVATSLLNKVLGYNIPVFLEVEENNKSAIHLYQKRGFQDFGVRKDYYGRGRNAVLMKTENVMA